MNKDLKHFEALKEHLLILAKNLKTEEDVESFNDTLDELIDKAIRIERNSHSEK